MTAGKRRVWLVLTLTLLVLGGMAVFKDAWTEAGAVQAQDLAPSPGADLRAAPDAPLVSVSGPADPVQVDRLFTVTVAVAQMDSPLSAFQFDLSYDPTVIAYVGSETGDLLASTGRTVVCPTPAQVLNNAVRLACASTGLSPGPTGAGSLAVLTFQALAAGESDLGLSYVQLSDDASPPALIEAAVQGGHVLVGADKAAVVLSGDQGRVGTPGADITYVFTLTNQGSASDTFGLTLAENSWPTTLSTAALGPLAAGEARTFSLTVSIPAQAEDGQQDSALVTAVSNRDPGVTAQVRATTTARFGEHRIHLPLILKNGSPQSQRLPGNGRAGPGLWLAGMGLPLALFLVGSGRRTRRRPPWQRLWSLIALLGILAGLLPPVQAAPLPVTSPLVQAGSLPAAPPGAGGVPGIAAVPFAVFQRQATGSHWADLDDDHDVDGNDLRLLADYWNCSAGQPCYDARYDRDGDGDVDAFDLAHLGNQYDIEPPELVLITPVEGTVVGGGAVNVSGTVNDTHAIAAVTVNGVAATVGGGLFQATVNLPAGNQSLQVVARDELGATTTAARLVFVDQEGPALTVHAPRDRQAVYTLRPTLAISYTDFYTGVNTASLQVTLTDENGAVRDVTGDLTIGPQGASGQLSADLSADMAYTLTASVADSWGNAATVQTTFLVPDSAGSITPPEETQDAGWVSGVVYDSSTCEGGQEQPVRCQGLPGAAVTLAYADHPTATITGTVVTGPDGFFAFPVAQTDRYWLRVEKADYTYGQREAVIIKEHATPVNEIYLTPLDANHQICDSTGCDLTSSDGRLRVQIPAGAITGTDTVDLSATFFDQVEYLPSGGLPEGTWETFAFNLGGNSVYSFTQPITVWVSNTLGFAPDTPIPLGYWNPDTQEWEHAGVSRVDAGGGWVVFTTTHLSNYDCNVPVTLPPAEPEIEDNTDPTAPCGEKDTSGSAILLRSGVLRQDFDLPPVQIFGESFAPTLHYGSDRADPSELIEFKIGLNVGPGIELGNYVQVELFIEGIKTDNFTFAANALMQGGEIGHFRYLWDGRDAQGNRLPPGVYYYAVHVRIPYRAQYYRSLDGRFGGPPDYVNGATGVYVNAMSEEWSYGTVTLASGQAGFDAPLGVGWALKGMQRLYEDEVGHILIDSGCCLDEYYFSGKALVTEGMMRLSGGAVSGSSVPRNAPPSTETVTPTSESAPPPAERVTPLPLSLPPVVYRPTGVSINVSGAIVTHTTWITADSPYILTSDVVVTPGITLTIEPGVTVMGQDYAELKVQGHLAAVGTVTQPITFTSAADSGPGEWAGLVFDGSAGGGTGDLRHVIVRYGGDGNSILSSSGSNIAVKDVLTGALRLESSQVLSAAYATYRTDYGLYADNSRVVVSDTLFADNGDTTGDYALYATGGGAVTLTGNAFQDNAGWAVGIGAENLSRVAGNTFSGNGQDRILVGGGMLGQDATITAQPGLAGYELDDDVTVPASVTLTIGPGVTVMGQTSAELKVQGHLDAAGSVTQPITFTSAADSGPGEWAGLVFDGSAGGGTGNLRHVTVRYGGNHSSVLPYIYSGSSIAVKDVVTGQVRIESSRVLSTSYVNRTDYGLYATNSRVVVSDTLFAHNGDSNSDYALYATGGGAVTLTGNAFQNNAGWAVRIDAENLHRVTGNTFSGNGWNRILIGGGTLGQDATITAQPGLAGYELDDDVTVPASVTLTIGPGATVMGQGYTELKVQGHLEAVGTVTQPITFTSAADSGPGEWSGLVFDGSAGGGTGNLRHVTVRYGGNHNSVIPGSYSGSNIAIQDVLTGQVRIESSRILYISGNGNGFRDDGLYAINSNVTVSDTLFAYTGDSDSDCAVYAEDGNIAVTGSTFEHNASYPLHLPVSALGALENNIFLSNGKRQIWFDGDGTLSDDLLLTYQDDLTEYKFYGNLTVPAGMTLTVEPGLTLSWYSYKTLTIHGALFAIGTSARPITFTSNAGWWSGIVFGDGTGELDHAIVRDATTGLTADNGNIVLRQVAVTDNWIGIHLRGDGVSLAADNCDISGNRDYGLFNESNVLIDARYNWWGHPSGPYHPVNNHTGQGDRVSDDVLFEPWLEEDIGDVGIENRTASDNTVLTYSPADGTYTRYYPDGREIHFNADGSHDYTLDPTGNKTAYAYNPDGTLAALSITPQGESTPRWTWTFAYQNGRLSAITDPAGRVTTIEIDDHGDLVAITDPEGATLAFAYDAAHHMTQKQDKLGNLTTYVYDAHGRLSRLELPPRGAYDPATGAYTTTQEIHTYTPSDVGYQLVNDLEPGAPGSPTEALITSTLLVAQATYASYQESYRTDAWGFATESTDGLGRQISYRRDEAGRATGITFPAGNCTEYRRDEWGNVVQKARMPADQCALPEEQRDPARVQVWTYTYDARFHDKRTAETDPLGNRTTYEYDDDGNLVTKTLPAVMTPGGLVTPTITYAYNAQGQKTQETDALGVATCYLYTQGTAEEAAGGSNPLFAPGVTPVPGLLTQEIRDCGGLNQTVTYREFDGAGNPQIIEGPGASQVLHRRYDSFGHVISETNALEVTTLYEYDGAGNLIRKVADYTADGVTGRNLVTEYTYDAQGYRLGERTEADGLTVQYAYGYDADHNQVMEQDPLGNTTWHTYDAAGQIVRTVSPGGFVYDYTYTENGQPLTESDGAGHLTRYVYDDLNRQVAVIQDEGGLNLTTVYTYNLGDQVTAYQNPDGSVVRVRYDPQGRRIAQAHLVDGQWLTRTLAYDAVGHLVQEVDERGVVTEYTYDALGRKVRTVKDAGGLDYTTVYTYDLSGNLIASRDERGALTTFEYDALNRLIRQVDDAGGLNRETVWTYDRLGHPIEIGRPDGTVQRTEVNGFGLPVVQIEDADGLAYGMTLEYDNALNLVRQVDPHGNALEYSYTPEGQIGAEVYADDTSIAYTYDSRGLITHRTLADGQEVNYQYDGAGRLSQRTYGDGTTDTFAYDPAGRMVQSQRVEGGHTVLRTYAYDAIGNVIRNTLTVDGQSYTTLYAYDYAAGTKTITYPSGSIVVQAVDPLDRLLQVQQDGNLLASWVYDDAAGSETLTYANGQVITTQYDPLRQVTQIASGVADYRYGYDGVGRRLWMQRAHQAGAPYDVYVHDGSGQVTQVYYQADANDPAAVTAYGRMVDYTVDALRNRVRVEDSVSGATAYGPSDGTRLIDPMNRYRQVGSAALTYDGRGNLTSDGVHTFAYDDSNRLVSAVGDGHTVVYLYDATGIRVARIADGEMTVFVSTLRGHVLEERDGTGALAARYVYGQGTDQLLTMERGGQRYFYQQDALGSVTELTDAGGALVERYEYDIYGAVTIYDGGGQPLAATAVGNLLYFTGRPYDPLAGLYHIRARVYDPDLGRFLQPDPLGATDSPNLYTYANNAPTSWTDPLGLTIKIGKAIFHKSGKIRIPGLGLKLKYGIGCIAEFYTEEQKEEGAGCESTMQVCGNCSGALTAAKRVGILVGGTRITGSCEYCQAADAPIGSGELSCTGCLEAYLELSLDVDVWGAKASAGCQAGARACLEQQEVTFYIFAECWFEVDFWGWVNCGGESSWSKKIY